MWPRVKNYEALSIQAEQQPFYHRDCIVASTDPQWTLELIKCVASVVKARMLQMMRDDMRNLTRKADALFPEV